MACSRTTTLLLGLALAAAAPAPSPDPRLTAALAGLAAKDLRVATVAYRVQTAAAHACRDRTTLPGLIVQDARQYRADLRPAMAALFHVGAYPAITGVVAGGAADRAGLRAGDEVMALDGAPLADPSKAGRKADGDAYGAIVDRIAQAFARGRASLTIRRDGRVATIAVTGAPACASSVQLDLATGRDAGADGSTVTISQGLLDFTRSDDELAFVLGHELAHHILGHRSTIGSARRRTAPLGSDRATIIETEREADYWGLYLAAWAGYDVTRIPAFWDRIARAGWLSDLFADGSHPGNRSRTRDLARAVREIEAARAAGRPLVPHYAAFAAAR